MLVLLCFFPETHPRDLDIRQHAENTNNITTPPSSTSRSGPHHERAAGRMCTAVASCSIEGCDPTSVITASLSLFCCAGHVCAVRRACAAKNRNFTMPDFGFDCVSSSLAEFMSNCFFSQLFSNFFFNFFFVTCT